MDLCKTTRSPEGGLVFYMGCGRTHNRRSDAAIKKKTPAHGYSQSREVGCSDTDTVLTPMPCSDTDAVLNSLLRLSVGIENMDDLMEDVTQVTDR